MTDRELLEAAAKAAGYDDAKYKDMEGWGEVRHGLSDAMWSDKLYDEDGSGYWNPLVDDAQALRLAVKLEIDLHFYEGHEVDALFDGRSRSCSEPWGQDGIAAARRAIVRAAASIGKNHATR